jgi:hypothetical protein
MKDQLFIPDDLKVGYQKRSDTYTSNLGYVIYKDSKKQWRQEKSWEGWRNKEIDAKEFENKPTEGFVVNRDVGGVRRSYSSWHGRMEKVRIFDPRDFEIEITVENLLYVLQEANSIKGKGLEGQFVYAWKDKQLVLLPVGAQEYENSTKFTALQSGKVSARTLVAGGTYQTKSQENIVFLGKIRWHSWEYLSKKKRTELGENITSNYSQGSNSSKQYVFADKNGKAFPVSNVSSLAGVVSETPVSNYAELMEAFNQRIHSSKIVALEAGSPKSIIIDCEKSTWNDSINYKINDRNDFFKKIDDNTFEKYCIDFVTNNYDSAIKQYQNFSIRYYKYQKYKLMEDGELYELNIPESEREGAYSHNANGYYSHQRQYQYPTTKVYTEAELPLLQDEINKMNFIDLVLVMESGAKYTLSEYTKLTRGY